MILTMLVLLAAQGTPVPTPTPTPEPPARLQARSTTTPPAVAGGGSLADVARTITLRRVDGEERPAITNEMLREIGRGVALTTGIAQVEDRPPLDATERDRTEEALKERWQRRYSEALGRVQMLETEIRRLEGEVARLERRYYAEDNPHYRDGVIKPAWDKALIDLRRNRAELEEARGAPREIMNEARREGALPGWFRGLEPRAPRPEETREAERRDQPEVE